MDSQIQLFLRHVLLSVNVGLAQACPNKIAVEPLLMSSLNNGHLYIVCSGHFAIVQMNMQPSNTNRPTIQQTPLTMNK